MPNFADSDSAHTRHDIVREGHQSLLKVRSSNVKKRLTNLRLRAGRRTIAFSRPLSQLLKHLPAPSVTWCLLISLREIPNKRTFKMQADNKPWLNQRKY
jgi:hypothetical protein